MTQDLRMPGDYEFVSLHHGFITQRQWNRNKLLLIQQLKFLRKEDRLLDAGCGSGNALLHYAKKVKSAQGWDINPNSIKFLKKKLKEKGIKNVKIAVHNLTTTKQSNTFTKIMLSEVIEHFSEVQYKKMLKHLHASLKKEGKIFITTPNDRSHWPLLEKMLNVIQAIKKIPTLEDRHIAHFTKEKLEKNVKNSGFFIEKSGTLNFLSPFLIFLPQDVRDKVHRWESQYIPFGGLLYVVARKK